MTITIEWGVVVAVVGVLIGMGVSWGAAGIKLTNVDARLGKIEAMLADGRDAVFARRAELESFKELVIEWKSECGTRFERLEKRRPR